MPAAHFDEDEDPLGRLRELYNQWRIFERIRIGRKNVHGEPEDVPYNVLSIGDFVEVNVTLDVCSTHDGVVIHLDPNTIVQLCSAAKMVSAQSYFAFENSCTYGYIESNSNDTFDPA